MNGFRFVLVFGVSSWLASTTTSCSSGKQILGVVRGDGDDGSDASDSGRLGDADDAGDAQGPLPPPSVFVSPAGNDADPCSREQPCLTLDRAYRVAQPGQVVGALAGSYGPQTVLPDATKTSDADVVVVPLAAGGVTFGDVLVRGSHFTLQGAAAASVATTVETDDVTFRDLAVSGGFDIASSSNITVSGGSFGPGTVSPRIGATPTGTHPRNIVVDGVLFHDWTDSATINSNCLGIYAGDAIFIRRSRFVRCDHSDLFVSAFNADVPTANVVVENNFFDQSRVSFYSLEFNNAVAWSGIVVRYNSALQSMSLPVGSGGVTSFLLTGNLAPRTSCPAGIVYSHNVWDGIACGSSDLNAPLGFRDPASVDLHLVPGAAAIDRGDPADMPAVDIDGDTRPRGSAPDVGADEGF